MVCKDMKREPASGRVIVTGPASRSKTAVEYRVSRLARIDCLMIDGHRLAVMQKPGHPNLLYHAVEIGVRLSADEVADRDRGGALGQGPGRSGHAHDGESRDECDLRGVLLDHLAAVFSTSAGVSIMTDLSGA